MPGLLAAPKRSAGGTDLLFSGFSISLFNFINAPFYHAFIAFLSQEGQEGQEGQDIFRKCEKHWEIEGFLWMKSEGRNPKSERNPNSETRMYVAIVWAIHTDNLSADGQRNVCQRNGTDGTDGTN